MSALIRRAVASDVPGITDIYNHYVRETSITFDIEQHTVERRTAWFAQFRETGPYQCFVAEGEGALAGYACSTQFRPKAAYDTTVEVTIYLRHDRHGSGLGSALYGALFDALAGEDIHRAVAGVTLPNPVSIALHEKFGFVHRGSFAEVGRKFDRYWDVAWYLKDFD